MAAVKSAYAYVTAENGRIKIKYDRDFLIEIGNQVPPTRMPDMFPDVVKIPNRMNKEGMSIDASVYESSSFSKEYTDMVKRFDNCGPPPPVKGQPSGPIGPAKKGKQEGWVGWNMKKDNKPTVFQSKKSKKVDQAFTLPVLTPPTQTWGRNPTSSKYFGEDPPQTSKPAIGAPSPYVPNRFQRFQGLSEDTDRLNNSISDIQPPPFNYHNRLPLRHTTQENYCGIQSTSSASTGTSFKENSRPEFPKDLKPLVNMNALDCTADDNESVKNIFADYLSFGRFDDTLNWIRIRFPDGKIAKFVEKLSRQVGKMSKLLDQQKAGSLIRSLIKANVISKESVLTILADGVIAEIPDVKIAAPMIVNYLSVFLVEVFIEELNLDWLIAIRKNFINYVYCTWKELCNKTLNLLKSKLNEQSVRSMFGKTKNKTLIPVEGIPWLTSANYESPDQMFPMQPWI